ncbi:MAG: hypothetical protein RSH25_16070 [Bacteroides sp.]|uniref:hypothetical protein n=1 Tax=Bacteroides sp. TaxID=29523 RepID=UPI002FC5A6CC
MEKKDKSIELRSEKVRNIIGQVPSALVRSGTLIICIVLVILFVISIFVPYRETISVQVEIKTYPEAHFIHSSEAGFFLSDSILATIHTGSTIGYIIGKSSTKKIISPITGDILMNTNNQAYIDKGGLLCMIIPKNHICYGITEIAIEDYDKVKQGNRIIMTLGKGSTINGVIEKRYPLSDNQYSHKVKIKFEKDTLEDKLAISTIKNAKIILNDVSILKKFVSSVGMNK